MHTRPILNSTRWITPALLFAAAACAAPMDDTALAAQDITQGVPEDVGFSSEGLAAIGPAMQELVDARRTGGVMTCLLYTSPSPRDQRGSRMPSSA